MPRIQEKIAYRSELAVFRKSPKRIGKSEVIVHGDFIAVDADLFYELETPKVIVKRTSRNDIVIQEWIGDGEESAYYAYAGAIIIPTGAGKNVRSGGYKAKLVAANDAPKYIMAETTLRRDMDRVLPDPVS